MSITVGWQYFEHTATELKDRNIECTATEVEYGNLHILMRLVDTVSQSCGSRLVHNTLYFQTGNLAGFFGSLTLRIGEISRNGNNGFRHFLSQIILSGLFHFLQNHCRDFLRSIETSVNIHTRSIVVTLHYFIRYAGYFFLYLIPVLTHETFDWEHCSRRVCDSLTLCRVTHLAFTTVHKRHNRRSGALAFAVCNYYRFVSFEYGNARVCCS